MERNSELPKPAGYGKAEVLWDNDIGRGVLLWAVDAPVFAESVRAFTDVGYQVMLETYRMSANPEGDSFSVIVTKRHRDVEPGGSWDERGSVPPENWW